MNILKSSTGEGMSATIQGLLVLLIPVIVAVGAHFNIVFTDAELTQNVSDIALVVGSLVTVFGAVRRVFLWLVGKLGITL